MREVADAKAAHCVIGDACDDSVELTDCASDIDQMCVQISGSRGLGEGVEPFSQEMNQ